MENYKTTIDIIYAALSYNGINMAIALIGMEIITAQETPKLLLELDDFLWDNEGEITEEEFQSFVDRAKILPKSVNKDYYTIIKRSNN